METFSYIVLVPLTYLAAAVFVLGTTYSFLRVWRHAPFAPTLQLYPAKRPGWLFALRDTLLLPSVMKENFALWTALGLFHVGLLFLLIGHLELLKDFRVLQIVPHAIFLGKGAVGLALIASVGYFFLRRLASPTKDISVPEDYLLLALLFVTVLVGAMLHWARAWFDYSTMGVDDYRTYLQSLFTLHPDIKGVTGAGHAFVLTLHVLLADLLLMVFPFTKLMHAIFGFATNAVRRG